MLKPKKHIRLSKSCIGEREKEAVIQVLNNEYLGMGKSVQEFEKKLSVFFNREVVCVSSGTAALQLALQAANIRNGDEVLVQSITYVSSFQSILANDAVPIACEINPQTLTIDLKDAESKITPNTKAIMPVHYAGGVGDLNKIYKFAEKFNLRVIEDAAHAFGSVYKSKKIGGIGDISCFSFDGIKNITCGEGGCVVSQDDKVLNKIKDIRLLGVERDSEIRYEKKRSWDFDVSSQGWRYHMSNIMAAIGIVQLERFSELSVKRQDLAKSYDDLLSKNSLVNIVNQDYNNVVPHIYPALIPQTIDREKLRKKLLNYGIETGIHYKPNHMLTLFRSTPQKNLPISESIYQQLISLPLHPDLSDDDIKFISKVFIDCVGTLINER